MRSDRGPRRAASRWCVLLTLGVGSLLIFTGCTAGSADTSAATGALAVSDLRAGATAGLAFQRIAGVRELPGGAVLVLDDLEPAVFLLDSLLQGARQISRVGQGPGEFVRPVRLLELMGGGTLVVDVVPGRHLLVDERGDSRTINRLSEIWHCPEGIEDRWIHTIRLLGADTLGRLYTVEFDPSTHPSARGESTSPMLVVWTPGCRHEEWGVLPSAERETSPGAVRAVGDHPFEPVSSLGVLPGAGVLAVHASPFSLELLLGPGQAPLRTELNHLPVALSEAHKSWWRNETARPLPGLLMRSDGFRRGQIFRLSVRDPRNWPSTIPPVPPGGLTIDRRGLAWLQRTGEDPAEVRFDVHLPTGPKVDSILVPRGRRLVGHGRGAFYTAWLDRDGFEYLERYVIDVEVGGVLDPGPA